MDQGADMILFGYHWSSSNPDTVVAPSVPQSLVSDNMLYTLIVFNLQCMKPKYGD